MKINCIVPEFKCPEDSGHRVYTRIRKEDWTLINNNGLVSLTPSIGNWKGEKKYHAHYYITNNKIVWH